MLLLMFGIVKSTLYDTVTYVPVLIPAELLPGERPSGKQTFRIYFSPISRPRRKSESALPRPPVRVPEAEQPVLQLRATDLSPKSRVGKKVWKILGKMERSHLCESLALRAKLQRGRPATVLAIIYKALQMAIWGDLDDVVGPIEIPRSSGAWKRWGKYFSKPRSRSRDFAAELADARAHETVVAALVSHALRDARMVLWWSGAEFTPAIWCDNLETAVYALALPMFAGGDLLGLCLRCKQIFVRKRSDQEYCSHRHREADRVARWREKQRKRRATKAAAKPARRHLKTTGD
jgi:hypothetical protein